MNTVIIKLHEFEGPIELLWALVQKDEIKICNLSLNALMEQMTAFIALQEDHFDLGAESIGHASNLLWLKSRALLPKNEEGETHEEDFSASPLALLQKLVEYCTFKEAAKTLSYREEKAKESYLRPLPESEGIKKSLGIEHVSLTELAAIFQSVLKKAVKHRGFIDEEEWKVSDKIAHLREALKTQAEILFEWIFSPEYTKLELIVFFLAILELMKLNEIRVIKKNATMVIIPYA